MCTVSCMAMKRSRRVSCSQMLACDGAQNKNKSQSTKARKTHRSLRTKSAIAADGDVILFPRDFKAEYIGGELALRLWATLLKIAKHSSESTERLLRTGFKSGAKDCTVNGSAQVPSSFPDCRRKNSR